MRSFCLRLLRRQASASIGPLFAAVVVAAPLPACAGFLDFLFGGAQERPSTPSAVTSYAEPSAPVPSGPENLHSGAGVGRATAFCVRLCDGQHFPLDHLANATPVETCRAMCPASKTKVFFGSAIDRAVARDGARYADLDAAFVYRARLVPNCTCNGKDVFGLAHVDLSRDPTLRPRDIVATKNGFVAYAGKRGQADAFTPLNAATVNAELYGGSPRVRLSREGDGPAIAVGAAAIIVPPAAVQAAR